MAVRHYIVGNWKMNGSLSGSKPLVDAVVAKAADLPETTASVLCPPSVLIPAVAGWVKGSKLAIGGQDCHTAANGAHTGDISAPMLAEAGCRFVILGHSERRAQYGETDAMVAAKAEAALAAGMTPIVCVGETLAIRESGEAEVVVAKQLLASLPKNRAACLIAYEPIWAIGSGRVAEIADILCMHIALQLALGGDAPHILYGGSVKAGNAAEILDLPAVGGVLVGGASLDADAFTAILAASAGL